MYTKRDYDEKYEKWKEVFEDVKKTNEEIRHIREQMNRNRASSQGFFDRQKHDETEDYLRRREEENNDRLIDYEDEDDPFKMHIPKWHIPKWHYH